VTLSSLGDAKSLAGGVLVRSTMFDAFGNPVALVQGAVSVGGYAFSTGSGGAVQKNHPFVGRIPSGGVLTRDIATTPDSLVNFTLHSPNPSLLNEVVERIGTAFPAIRTFVEGNSLRIYPDSLDPNRLVAMVETLAVADDTPARVVINERTGTVVIGGEVYISPCAVSHGDIVIQISSFPEVSQPLPFSEGETVTTWQDSLFVDEDKGSIFRVGGETTVQELVQGLNIIGVTPRDIIAIFQAIKQAGALKAELVVM